MGRTLVFRHPEPERPRTAVWPVFLPFAGCPYRCVFCAQDKQTGQGADTLETILQTTEEDLAQALEAGRGPYEIAFYGGTFSALPEPWPERFLGLAMRYREKGLITRIRCSTRPDCVEQETLDHLRSHGLDMVELGVQSFNDAVLSASVRGYDGQTALAACDRVKASGLALGIQLLPGLPGDQPGVFQTDVQTAAELRPEVARLYPCLVIDGTPLARMWRRGDFTPWELERTKRELADALLVFWEHDVRVIRLGLPPEGTLEEHILAGPWHPALGQSARGRALLSVISKKVEELGEKPELLEVPRRYQGELMGHGGELSEEYTRLGLHGKVAYRDKQQFQLK